MGQNKRNAGDRSKVAMFWASLLLAAALILSVRRALATSDRKPTMIYTHVFNRGPVGS